MTWIEMWIHAAWLAAGLLLGIGHAASIRRSAGHPGAASAVAGLARLLVVGLALTAAAFWNGLVPTAVGWVIGFFTRMGLALATRSHLDDRSASS